MYAVLQTFSTIKNTIEIQDDRVKEYEGYSEEESLQRGQKGMKADESPFFGLFGALI
jgi:hypothetical protein